MAVPATVLHVQRRTIPHPPQVWRTWHHSVDHGRPVPAARQRPYAQPVGGYLCGHLQRRAEELGEGVEDGDVLAAEGLRGQDYFATSTVSSRNCDPDCSHTVLQEVKNQTRLK